MNTLLNILKIKCIYVLMVEMVMQILNLNIIMMNTCLQSLFQKNNRLCSPFKRVLKLDDKNSALKSVLCMIIDKLNLEPNRDKKGIFKFTILPEKVKYI